MSHLSIIQTRLQPIELKEPSIHKISATYRELQSVLVRGTRFEGLAESLKANIVLILHFFENSLEELEPIKLTELVEKTMPRENLCENTKTLLRLMRDVFQSLKRKNEHFLRLHKDFGYHNLLFIQLWKLKQTFQADISQAVALKLWTVFVYLSKITNVSQNVSEMLDLLTVIVIEQVTMAEKENRPFEQANCQINDTIGYAVEADDYERWRDILTERVPDFESANFPVADYQSNYLDSLEKHDLNCLFFLETLGSANPPAPILTPMHNGKVSRVPSGFERQELNFSNQNINKIQISNNFQDMVSVIKEPEPLLCSPMLKKRFERGDKAMEFSRMYQWYKDTVHMVKLIQVEVGESSYRMSEEFSKFAKLPFVISNFKEVMLCLDKLSAESREFTLKLFFRLVDQFFTNELKSSGFETVQELLKDVQFVKSVLCLASEFNSFIVDRGIMPLGQFLNICEISYTDLWKVLYNFAVTFGKTLPSLLQSHIVELEFDILLRGLWTNSEVERIFETESRANDVIVKRILNILAERLYLVTSDCNLNDDMKQQVWELTKHVIFPDLCKLVDSRLNANDLKLRTNVHLDWIILCCIYHLIYSNKLYMHLKEICDIYSAKVLFAQPNIRDEVGEYYQKIFKPNISTGPLFLAESKPRGSLFSRESANSTPIRDSSRYRMRNILSSPLVENLNMKLEKRSVEGFFNPLQLEGSNRRSSITSLKSAKLLQFGEMTNNEDDFQPKALFNLGLMMKCSPLKTTEELSLKDVSKDVSIVPPELQEDAEVEPQKSGNVTPGFN